MAHFFLPSVFDAVLGDHAAGVGIVRPEAEEPRVVHVRERRVGAADHHGLGNLQNVGRHRVDLRRADRAEEGDHVWLRRQFREGEHDAGVGRLVVLDDELDLLAQHAARLVDGVERELGTDLRVVPRLGGRTGDRRAHADLDRGALRRRAADEGGPGQRGRQCSRERAARYGHGLSPDVLVFEIAGESRTAAAPAAVESIRVCPSAIGARDVGALRRARCSAPLQPVSAWATRARSWRRLPSRRPSRACATTNSESARLRRAGRARNRRGRWCRPCRP